MVLCGMLEELGSLIFPHQSTTIAEFYFRQPKGASHVCPITYLGKGYG